MYKNGFGIDNPLMVAIKPNQRRSATNVLCMPDHIYNKACIDLAATREIFYSASSMKDLLKKAKLDAIISFLKAVGLDGKVLKSDNSENYWIK